MCGEKDKCENPDKLKGTPSQCSPEQIRECHGDAAQHPCEQEQQDPSDPESEVKVPRGEK